MKKLKDLFAEIPETVTVTGLEGILALTVGILAGVILGMLCSPRRSIRLGCNNGNKKTVARKWHGEDDGDGDIPF